MCTFTYVNVRTAPPNASVLSPRARDHASTVEAQPRFEVENRVVDLVEGLRSSVALRLLTVDSRVLSWRWCPHTGFIVCP